MPAPSSPPRSPWQGGPGYRRYFRYNGDNLRVSDAERSEMADRLSRHYQDGRLDQAEFDERVERAMTAKTMGDFSGLFDDLPDLPFASDRQGQAGLSDAWPVQNRRVRRSRGLLTQVLTIVAIVVIAGIAARTVMNSALLWVLVAVLAFLWLRNEDRRRRS